MPGIHGYFSLHHQTTLNSMPRGCFYIFLSTAGLYNQAYFYATAHTASNQCSGVDLSVPLLSEEAHSLQSSLMPGKPEPMSPQVCLPIKNGHVQNSPYLFLFQALVSKNAYTSEKKMYKFIKGFWESVDEKRVYNYTHNKRVYNFLSCAYRSLPAKPLCHVLALPSSSFNLFYLF